MVRENIFDYLRANGIKQEFLATKANLTPVAISNLANGKRGLDVEEYVRICNALGVSFDTFLPSKGGTAAKGTHD